MKGLTYDDLKEGLLVRSSVTGKLHTVRKDAEGWYYFSSKIRRPIKIIGRIVTGIVKADEYDKD